MDEDIFAPTDVELTPIKKRSSVVWLIGFLGIVGCLYLLFFIKYPLITLGPTSESQAFRSVDGHWTLYSNFKYGYQIGYPRIYHPTFDTQDLKSPYADKFHLYSGSGTNNLIVSVSAGLLPDLGEEAYLKNVYGGAFPTSKYVTFRGLNAVKYSSALGEMITVVKDGYVYTILMEDESIINTFKFTR